MIELNDYIDRLKPGLMVLAKLALSLAMLAVAFLTVQWVLGSGGDDDGAGSSDETPTVAATDSETPTTTTPPAGTVPATEESTDENFDPELYNEGIELTVTPSTQLADGVEIELNANLSPDDVVGLTAEICATGSVLACTQISPVSMVQPNENVTASLVVPRRYLSLTGELHDCIEISPCELRVLFHPLQTEPAIAELEFDPDAPLRPTVAMTVTPDGPHEPVAEVRIISEVVAEYTALQCAADLAGTCEVLVPELEYFEGDRGFEQTATIARTINTPTGAHDCVSDGPCELRFIAWEDVLVDPIPLEFDPTIPLPESLEAQLHPSTDLSDSQLVEIRVRDSTDTQVAVLYCKVDTRECLDVATVVTIGGAGTGHLRLPRRFSPAAAEDPIDIDCATDPCEIRVETRDSSVSLPIEFNPLAPERTRPEIRLDAPDPLEPGASGTVHGRGFLVIDSESPAWVNLFLCSAADSQLFSAECGQLRASASRVESDGTFSASVTIPSESSIGVFSLNQSICSPICHVVATTQHEGFGPTPISVEVEVVTPPS